MWFLFLEIWVWVVIAFALGWSSHWFLSSRGKEVPAEDKNQRPVGFTVNSARPPVITVIYRFLLGETLLIIGSTIDSDSCIELGLSRAQRLRSNRGPYPTQNPTMVSTQLLRSLPFLSTFLSNHRLISFVSVRVFRLPIPLIAHHFSQTIFCLPT